MPTTDSSIINEKILRFLEIHGPSLPVHLAREVGMDMIFTSAFLSELLAHQKIKTSHMRVGTSPVYFLPGQEEGLEKFSEYIKGKEHEALNLLKKNKFLIDSEQEPAIRVALRAIKDFAKILEKNEILVWRYFTAKEEKSLSEEKKEVQKEILEKEEIHKKEAGIIEKKEKSKQIKSKTKKITKENDEKLYNKVKGYLSKKGFEMLDIINFNKKDLILKISKDNEEKLLFAYNKKRINQKDILNCYKKSEEKDMNYLILSLGEIPKKTKTFIDAARKLDSIDKLD